MIKYNPHSKHRQRVRREFLENGFTSATPPHKILELLLFYSIPRKDTNEIAHALLNRFGSISAVLEASQTELMRVEGIGESSAVLIKLLLPIFRAYEDEGALRIFNPNSLDDICEFIKRKYIGLTKEAFAVTSFNSRNEIIAFDIIATGDISSVGISTRSVAEKIIERKGVCAVISHNHPNGRAFPSPEDVSLTRDIFNALKYLNIPLIDHIVVSNIDNDCISMAQSERYCRLFR